MELRLREGGQHDAEVLLAMFDDAVAWLTARGSAGQWGDRPWSEQPERIALVRELAAADGLWIAEADGTPAGALVVRDKAPEYVPPADAAELYVLLLITAREFAGQGVGTRLVAHARQLARQSGRTLLRADCWAGGDGDLVRYYRRAGFTPTGTFDIDGWPGQILEQTVPGP
jgi:GNAT superfamily N-acetyltransferase